MRILTTLIFFVFAGNVLNGLAQEKRAIANERNPDSVKRQAERLRNIGFITRDAAKLEQVNVIQHEFKTEMSKLMVDSTIAYDDKVIKMQMLLAGKNIKLSKILTPEELKVLLSATGYVIPARIMKYPAEKPGNKKNLKATE